LIPRGAWGAAALAPFLLLAGSALASCSADAPAIQEVSPLKGASGVAADAPVRIVFDRSMDQASVASRLQLIPPLAGCDATTCPISWKGPALVLTHPGHEFTPGTRYLVLLKGGYRDRAGQANGLDHSWDFTAEDAPSLRSSSPAEGAQDVRPDADLTLRFSRRLLAPMPGQVVLDPYVPLRLTLDPADPTRLVVSPQRLLGPLSTYRLTVVRSLQDATHLALGKDLSITFRAGGLDLARSLAVGLRDVDGHATRIAALRLPAGIPAARPSLRLLYEAPGEITDFQWSRDARHLYVLAGGEVLQVTPGDGLAQATGITAVSIAPSPATDELAYVAPDHSLHLWRSEAAGPVDIPLPQAGPQLRAPAWSSDGSRLALAVDAGGSGTLGLLDRATLSRFMVPATTLPALGGTPMAWSFDGFSLAFAREMGGRQETWVYRPQDAGPHGEVQLGPVSPAALAWSSDGIAVFAAGPELDRVNASANAVARGFLPIQSSRPGDAEPTTSAFDRRLVFTRRVGATPQLWVMNTDGSGLFQLTSPDFDPGSGLVDNGVVMPRWAPGRAATAG
jgi:hypothetical protein